MTLQYALRNGWQLVRLRYDATHALVERWRADGLRELALALARNEDEDEDEARYLGSFSPANRHGAW